MSPAVALGSMGVGVLAVAWLGVCFVAGSAWPWGVVVHEDGRRTLLETVFYVEHALRELPLDLVLAAAVAGATLDAWPVASRRATKWRSIIAASLFLVVGGMVLGALREVGMAGALSNIAQMPTRDGAPLRVGAHWRYHLLSRLGLMLLAYVAMACVRSSDAGHRRAGPPWRSLYGASLAMFGGVTLVFGLSSEPFRDPVYLGHQARELMTHTLVTLPIAVAACLSCVRNTGAAWRLPGAADRRRVVVAAGLAVALGLYLAIGVLATGAVSQGQSTSVAVLIFPHFFEHVPSYVVVTAGAVSLYLWRAREDVVEGPSG